MREITTTAGPLFWIGMIVVAVFVLWFLIALWKKFIKDFQRATEADKAPPAWTRPVILTVLAIGAFSLASALVWNAMQSVTTNASTYTSKAEADYRQQVMESNLPSNEQLDQAKANMKNRAEVQAHQKALDDFDAKMAVEAAKIKQRSLGGTDGGTNSGTNQPAVEKQ